MSILIGVADFGISQILTQAQAASVAIEAARDSAQGVIDQASAVQEAIDEALQDTTEASQQAQAILTNINLYLFTPKTMAELRSQAGVGASRCELLGYYYPSDQGGGVFYWNTVSTATDDGGMVIKPSAQSSSTPGRWIRVAPNQVIPQMFGARSDVQFTNGVPLTGQQIADVGANTVCIQNAINFVVLAIDQASSGSNPISKARTNTLYMPSGTYYISNYLEITGPILIRGDGGTSFGGTLINSIISASGGGAGDIFHVTGSLQGTNCALQMEDIRIRTQLSGSGTGGIGVYSSAVGSKHSLYFNRVWFQGMGSYALKVLASDDLQVTNCVFDGGDPWKSFYLGDPGNMNNTVTNAVFSGNTYYNVALGIGELYNVDAFQFVNNRVFKALGVPNIPVGINAFGAVKALGVVVTGNTFTGIDNIYCDARGGFNFSNNTIQQSSASVVQFGGGTNVVVAGSTINNNTIYGTWDRRLTLNGIPNTPLAPFLAYDLSAFTNCQILNNTIIDETGLSITALYAANPRTTLNSIKNILVGFSTAYVIPNPENNLLDRGSVQVGRNPLSKSTSGWNTTTFNELVAPGTLTPFSAYMLTLYLGKDGVDFVTATYVVTVGQTSSANAQPPELTPLSISSYTAATSGLKVRLKRPTSGAGTHGIECTIGQTNLAGGTFRYQLMELTGNLATIAI